MSACSQFQTSSAFIVKLWSKRLAVLIVARRAQVQRCRINGESGEVNMVSVFLAIAFALGFAARQIGLPPLVGFLAAGFALKGLGFESSPLLAQLADLGVILLLFSIGLKLKIETLLKPEV